MLRRFASRYALWAGVGGPVLFTGVYLVEGALRPGYDPMRHQVSLLSLGPGGWIQAASFLATGALLLAFAAALGTRLAGGPGARGGPIGLGISGIGFVVAGLFATQPLFGYPPGTPPGMARDITATSVLHVIGAGLLFFGIVGAAITLGRRFRRSGSAGWAVLSFASAAVVVVFFGASGGGPSGELLYPAVSGLLQRIALITGLGWVAAIALREIRRGEPAASRPASSG